MNVAIFTESPRRMEGGEMIFNVASLLTAREGAVRMAEIENGEAYTDRHHFRRINGPVRMLRTDRTVLVSATVTASVEDTCSRCLSNAVLEVHSDFEEEFYPANRDLMSDRPEPVEAEFDPALLIDARNMLDITDALAQSLSLTLPLAPLCREDCAGICTACFTDRNQSACRCDETPTDLRWRALAELTATLPDSNN